MSEAPLSFKDDLWVCFRQYLFEFPSIKQHDQDCFETICGRLKQCSAFDRAFAAFFINLAKETREFARKVVLLTKTKDEEELFSVNLGWLAAKQEVEKIANVFLKLADDITYKVAQPVENQLKETSKIKRKVNTHIKKKKEQKTNKLFSILIREKKRVEN